MKAFITQCVLILLLSSLVRADDICLRGLCEGNLNISRADMPQIDTELKVKLLRDTLVRGTMILTPENVLFLKPSQKEIYSEKIDEIASFGEVCLEHPIVVHVHYTPDLSMRDYYIIDGHHRVFHCRLNPENCSDMKALVIVSTRPTLMLIKDIKEILAEAENPRD